MRARTKLLFTTILKALPAAAATKVSKPVLFALKMTDLQDPHKKDSPFEAGDPRQRFTPGSRPPLVPRQPTAPVESSAANAQFARKEATWASRRLAAGCPFSAALDLPTCGRIEARESCRL